MMLHEYEVSKECHSNQILYLSATALRAPIQYLLECMPYVGYSHEDRGGGAYTVATAHSLGQLSSGTQLLLQNNSQGGARAAALQARSFDLVRTGVAPPLQLSAYFRATLVI